MLQILTGMIGGDLRLKPRQRIGIGDGLAGGRGRGLYLRFQRGQLVRVGDDGHQSAVSQ
nr:hypothetical protein [uncultured Rhodopila sp.]